MSIQPTAGQQRAISTHDRNLVVIAGAGSGKTRVLVERYVALLAANPGWPLSALVAITFTEKAAQEMRDRVRSELEKRLLAADSDDDRRRWTGLLGQMDSARISTIHGLCAALLRANAAEAGVDPQFEVLDEAGAALLRSDIVEQVLRELDPDSTNDAALLRLFAEYDSSSVLAVLADPELLAHKPKELPPDLYEHWWELWAHNVDAVRERLRNDPDAQALLAYELAAPGLADDKLYPYFVTLRDHLRQFLTTDDTAAAERLREAAQSVKINVGSAANWGDAGTLKWVKRILGGLRDELKEVIPAPPGEVDRQAALLIPLWYGLLERVRGRYRQAKQERALLDFDDLERLAADLLTEFPDVRQRYRQEFRHLLVDEFQDTNKRQWGIVQRLVDLAEGGSLFVVGDPKQSIYAFRGADVRVFQEVRRIVLQNGGEDVHLARSFRTHAPLLDLLNRVFAEVLKRDESSPVRDYQVEMGPPMDAQRSTPPGPQPPVTFLLLDRNSLQIPDEIKGKRGGLPAAETRRWEAAVLAQYLAGVVAEGRPVHDRAAGEVRPIRYGDITLLLRRMSNIEVYEEALKNAGLPYVTVAGRGYFNRQEVWDLLNLLKAVHNLRDDLSLAAALRSPLFALRDDTLLALRLLRDENGSRLPLRDALWQMAEQGSPYLDTDEYDRLCHTCETILHLHNMAGRVLIADLLRLALDLTGYRAVLTGLPDGARRRGNVDKLVSIAESSGRITLGAFVQYLGDLSEREVREGEAVIDAADAITLMTVHASKGLEFPLVVLVDTGSSISRSYTPPLVIDAHYGPGCRVYDRQENKHRNSFTCDQARIMDRAREEAESRRLLYVAATRAQDYLVVSGDFSGDKFSGWLEWLMQPLNDQPLYDDGLVEVQFPDYMTLDEVLPAAGRTLWEHPAVREGRPLDSTAPAEPPLLQAVPAPPDAPARHLSATHVADLGGARHAGDAERRYYRERFRRQVFHSAPPHVPQVLRRREPRVTARKIGEIVHEALRYWHFPENTPDLDEVLRAYAWQYGLTQPQEQAYALRQARNLLERFQGGELYEWVNVALQEGRPLYRELSFIMRTDERIIHGVIDLLLQGADGEWRVVDYKTSHVRVRGPDDAAAYREHARRYHLQLGVYAAAVMQQLGGHVPRVYIHYIRHTQTVEIPPSVWQQEVAGLEGHIGSLIREEDV